MTNNTPQAKGLTCPGCSGVVPVPEGARIVHCRFCDLRSLVQGDRGVRRWQVINRVDRGQAQKTVRGFFSGFNKARDLRRKAEIREMFLVYFPYWRVQAFVAGWMFGRVKSGKNSTRPVEVEIMQDMTWKDAAADVSEFGVHRVAVNEQELEPYDGERLHAEGMVFEPSESRTEAMAEAEQHFIYWGRRARSLRTKYFEKFHTLRPQLGLVYYPLWVARYEYRQRNYQVVVDGVKGDVLYGKAPGNIFFRAAALVGGMASGTFLLTNGTILAAVIFGGGDNGDGLGAVLFPIALGLGLVYAGYRAFRYGEEVETIQAGTGKAPLAGGKEKGGWKGSLKDLGEVVDMALGEARKAR